MPEIDIYDPRIMHAAILQIPPANTFLKNLFFSTTETFFTEHVDIDYYKGGRKMAPFVSDRKPGKVMDRRGFTTKTFTPPQIKPNRILTPKDLQKRSMGENIYSPKSPEERAKEFLAKDLIEMDDAITRREEWLISQIMFNGQVHMIGEDVDQILDFNFTNSVELSGTDLWTSPDSDPLEDLKNWRLSLVQKSGFNPTHVIMASDVVSTFVRHPVVKDLLHNRRMELGQIKTELLPNGVTFVGTLNEIGCDIYSYDEWYVDDDTDPDHPTEKSMVPPGHVLMASTRARSTLLYGAATLMNEATKQFYTVEGTRIPDTWVEKNPASRTLALYSRPLPVPHDIDSWYVAKVI
ncbi:major capsid protein [Tumebacillus flagellatus]|uniref:Phage capsid protein n=1 Tax=Tumebacillus flagellatus TaxID=1157490 RepID=A0A074MGC4_9BACL|nr:major capsid protein [Tumebacillus flagellatus]KEO84762.1 hypothetical protein EL26_01765 [Tumebacillus flagellatus]